MFLSNLLWGFPFLTNDCLRASYEWQQRRRRPRRRWRRHPPPLSNWGGSRTTKRIGSSPHLLRDNGPSATWTQGQGGIGNLLLLPLGHRGGGSRSTERIGRSPNFLCDHGPPVTWTQGQEGIGDRRQLTKRNHRPADPGKPTNTQPQRGSSHTRATRTHTRGRAAASLPVSKRRRSGAM